MKIQAGDCLISREGRYYRVVDCSDQIVSLMPLKGYTLFACRHSFLESSFRPIEAQQVA